MIVKAHKRHFTYALQNQDKYLLFLKDHFQETEPLFYSVVCKKHVQAVDCKMWALVLDQDIENPNHEIIAECVINNEWVYLWRNKCWGIAVDNAGIGIIKAEIWYTPEGFNPHKPVRKTLLLFQIGSVE